MQVCYKGETPEGIADMVDMSADEVNDLLRGNDSIQAAPACNVMQAVDDTCGQLRLALETGAHDDCPAGLKLWGQSMDQKHAKAKDGHQSKLSHEHVRQILQANM